MSPLTPRGDVGRAEKTLTSAVSEGMTPEKISRLREVLTHRKVPTVKSMSPGVFVCACVCVFVCVCVCVVYKFTH